MTESDRNRAIELAMGQIEKQFGKGSIMRLGEDTVLPTVIIVDAEGRILFTDQTDNYRVRPAPEDFLKALRARSA